MEKGGGSLEGAKNSGLAGGSGPPASWRSQVLRGRDPQPHGDDKSGDVTSSILVAKNLSKSFGAFRVVSDVTLSVQRNTVHALIGPNGAGKTTFFNLLTRSLPLSSGTIALDGVDISNMRPARVARMGMVRSFQISAVFSHMTALENVRIALQGRLRGPSLDFWRSDRSLRQLDDQARSLLDDVGIGAAARRPAVELPYGQKRALEIATTMAMDPKLMLLDEPMAGLGQEDIARISALIGRLAKSCTILMVEHNLSVVAALSDRITVLARGAVLADGDYQSVSSNPDVIQSYIGG
jgi:branched-chain amino acid transport system ATP-binding protein